MLSTKLRKLRNRASCLALLFGVRRNMLDKGVTYLCAGMLTDLQFGSLPCSREVELQISLIVGPKISAPTLIISVMEVKL